MRRFACYPMPYFTRIWFVPRHLYVPITHMIRSTSNRKFFEVYTQSTKAQALTFHLFLHRNPKDERSTLPIYSVIPFISADPMDNALNLPGVSIARLLSKEQDILVNANSFIEDPKLGSDIQALKVNIIVRIL